MCPRPDARIDAVTEVLPDQRQHARHPLPRIVGALTKKLRFSDCLWRHILQLDFADARACARIVLWLHRANLQRIAKDRSSNFRPAPEEIPRQRSDRPPTLG